MKPKELMIGDWVDINGLPVQVFELAYNHNEKEMTIGILDPQGEIYSAFYGYDHIEPIPLTPEILEKNGFEFGRHEFKTRNDDYWISNDNRIILRGEDMVNSFNEWSVHVDTEDMRTMGYFEITYVHELQHALRLCGIDKNIEI